MKRLTAEEERAIGDRVLELERTIREQLEPIPACREVIERRSTREGRTRAAAVSRLHEAVGVATAIREALAEADDIDLDPPLAAAVGDAIALFDRIARAERAWAEAQELRWRLALSAVHVARRQAHQLAGNPVLAVSDLMQEGIVGLLSAATRFESDRGLRFSTYARWWVRAHMTRAIDEARLLTMSAGATKQLRNVRKVQRQREILGLPLASADVLAAEVGLEPDRVRLLLETGVPAAASIEPHEDDDERAPARIAAELVEERTPLDGAADLEEARRVEAAIAELPDRLRIVIVRRYGLGCEPESFRRIGQRFGVCHERIRQLHDDALRLLRRACLLPRQAA